MSLSVFDEEPRIPITSVGKEFAKKWVNNLLTIYATSKKSE